jgi:hypothetical protein
VLDNPFRILELSPETPSRQVERESLRILALITAGLDAPARPRTAEDVREAVSELHDPHTRALHELLCLSAPPKPQVEAALRTLAEVPLELPRPAPVHIVLAQLAGELVPLPRPFVTAPDVARRLEASLSPAQAALNALIEARGVLAQDWPAQVTARLAERGCTTWSEAQLLGAACAALNQFEDSARAFALAAALGEPPPPADRSTALARRAVLAAEPAIARTLLANRKTWSTTVDELAEHAAWTLVLKRLRSEVDRGPLAVMNTLGFAPPGEPTCAGISMRYLRVLTLLAQDRSDDARAEVALVPAGEPLCDVLRLVLHERPQELVRTQKVFAAACAGYPELARVLGMVEAAHHFHVGRVELAREAVKRIELAPDPELGLALLVAPRAPGGLRQVFEETQAGRHSAAAALLDVTTGHPCAELRVGLGAREASTLLGGGDVDGALREIAAALATPGEDGSRDALRRAQTLLEPMRWVTRTMDDPNTALAGTTDVRELAVLRFVALVRSPTADALRAAAEALERLVESRETLARYRLRVLELQGEAAPHGRSFEELTRRRLVELLAGQLRVMAELAPAEVHDALRHWEGREPGLVSEARDRVATELHDALRGAIDRATVKSAKQPSLQQAQQILVELDAVARRSIVSLRALATEAAMLTSATDAAARCFDKLSIDFYKQPGCLSPALA